MNAVPPQPGLSNAAARVRSIDLQGPAGRLEAVFNEGSLQPPAVGLVCHPHPLGGGTLHNKVVYHAMKALNAPQFGIGLPVLRFNFRGTGLSQGEHDGKAEKDDVLAALAWLQQEFNLPVIIVGFSFGAAMSLLASCGHSGVKAVAALGVPTHADGRDYHYHFLERCTVPKLFLSGNRDPYAPAADLEQVVSQAAEPKRLIFIPGADHFFTHHLSAMQSVLAAWVKEHTA